MSIIYGSYTFPEPVPIFSIADSPIRYAGELDQSLSTISVIGTITGSNITGLSYAKKQLISGMLSEYETLTIDGQTYTNCIPRSIDFSDSDLTTILPYSVSFERYDEKDFSDYYGVKDPVNTWSYSEQDRRIIQATHTVSAMGYTTGASDPLLTAKSFVESKITGFNNLSIINPSGSGFLRSKTEEVNRLTNFYSVSETYSFSSSREKINENAIITANTQISYSKKGEPSVNVNGEIIGDINGDPVTTGLFTPQDAKDFATNAIERSRSDYEDTVYGVLAKSPTSYNYNVDEVSNKISFGFQFKDAFNFASGNILHDYTVAVQNSKDDGVARVSVNGRVYYDTSFDIFSGGPIETSPRFLEVDQYFSGLNTYALALTDFLEVKSGLAGSAVVEYDCPESNYLNEKPKSESITKDPFEPEISYSYTYDNIVDETESDLKNFKYTVNDELAIYVPTLKPSNGGFARGFDVGKLGKISISASADIQSGQSISSETLKSGCLGVTERVPCHIISESKSDSEESVSYDLSFYYQGS
ncbi:hypothetical protein N9955_00845 [bacterium]|nr:hypothetical protein [bacterium]